MSDTPLLEAHRGEEMAAAAGKLLHGSPSDAEEDLAGEKGPKPKRAATSAVKKPQRAYLEPPQGRTLKNDEKPDEAGPSDVKIPVELTLVDPLVVRPLDGLRPLTLDGLRAAFVSWVPALRTAPHEEKKRIPSSLSSSLETLIEDSKRFANSAAASSMAGEAASFSKAVHEFDARRDKKITDTELSRTGRMLCAAADRAPASEAALAAIAVKLTGESLDILLSEENQKPAMDDCFCGCRCARWPSCLEWLRAAVSGPEPILPVHQKRQEKLVAKRQVLFGVALAAPVALLTSAAATSIFPSNSGPWIAGVTALVWVAVSAAVVANQYGKTDLELQVASCVGRLGVMSVTVLFIIYVFFAFFPSATIALVLLLAFAVGLHGCLYAASRLRGGDDESLAGRGDAEDTDGACSRCRCRRCTMDV